MTNIIRLCRATAALTVGDVHRHTISLIPSLDLTLFPAALSATQRLILKVTNTTPAIYNTAFLAGPYTFAASCINDHSQTSVPKFVPSILCGMSWKVELATTSKCDNTASPNQKFAPRKWQIELVSEVKFSKANVSYEVEISLETPTTEILRPPSSPASTTETGADTPITVAVYTPSISHLAATTSDIFNPPLLPSSSSTWASRHLVILTHGMHGTQSDLLYIRESIEQQHADDEEAGRVLVWSCDVNHTATQDGIEVAGTRIAEKLLAYLGWPWTPVDKVTKEETKDSTNGDNLPRTEEGPVAPITHISFIGHSLGGLLNIYVIGHLQRMTGGCFFRRIRPANFITLATPWCGSFELPWVAKQGLALGVLGQTGKDLALVKRWNEGVSDMPVEGEEPILMAMAKPESYAHRAMKMFERRTVYSNTEHDLTVGYQTSILWFCRLEDNREENVVDGNEIMEEGKDPVDIEPAQKAQSEQREQAPPFIQTLPLLPTTSNPMHTTNKGNRKLFLSNTFSQTSLPSLFSLNPFSTLTQRAETAPPQPSSLLPVPSLFSQLRSAISPDPAPDHWYLDRSTIPNPIIHDRVYTPADVLPSGSTNKDMAVGADTKPEEVIGRLWHSDMTFRKVCVRLHADAHVGIVVRRRWVNAGGGWNVVDHLIREHGF
ncbi:putative serine esterase-domain-containing protein [Jimgerdemannia flammicorona]|uniref:Putative serine esterase-domain-containing protein n=1 Tax=Jimgerdemannia flammicorona TaxID=994334 RepID=A0A433QEQ3_9FUNG|nr:putative serine esterase-domain-containing protein [Jimgerdemannia flammicorona]